MWKYCFISLVVGVVFSFIFNGFCIALLSLGRGFEGKIFQFLRIACTCLNPSTGQRPTMLEFCNAISILGKDMATQINCTETLRKSEIATPST